ncbi:hypothetical protein ACFT0G_06015 [Streptomyces sp. NPDC057020]|uniref:hypothetical protein n=1 Tax=Streptomyces sp. NPDC057020 TaxID=3346002 RepID=UPI003635E763
MKFGRRRPAQTSTTDATTTRRSTSGGWWSGDASDPSRTRDLTPRRGENTRRWRRDSLGRQD